MPINYSIRDWHGSDTAPNAPEPIRLRDAVAGLLDAQSVSISLGPDASAARNGYWRSPGYEVEVTGAFASAVANVTSSGTETLNVTRGAETIASEAAIQGKAIAGAMYALTNGTADARTVPANTLVRVAYSGAGTVSGGGGFTVHLTFKPTGN